MNELEKALSKDDSHVDIYLEDTPTTQIRADIEDIRLNAAKSSKSGRFMEEVRKLLSDNTQDSLAEGHSE